MRIRGESSPSHKARDRKRLLEFRLRGRYFCGHSVSHPAHYNRNVLLEVGSLLGFGRNLLAADIEYVPLELHSLPSPRTADVLFNDSSLGSIPHLPIGLRHSSVTGVAGVGSGVIPRKIRLAAWKSPPSSDGFREVAARAIEDARVRKRQSLREAWERHQYSQPSRASIDIPFDSSLEFLNVWCGLPLVRLSGSSENTWNACDLGEDLSSTVPPVPVSKQALLDSCRVQAENFSPGQDFRKVLCHTPEVTPAFWSSNEHLVTGMPSDDIRLPQGVALELVACMPVLEDDVDDSRWLDQSLVELFQPFCDRWSGMDLHVASGVLRSTKLKLRKIFDVGFARARNSGSLTTRLLCNASDHLLSRARLSDTLVAHIDDADAGFFVSQILKSIARDLKSLDGAFRRHGGARRRLLKVLAPSFEREPSNECVSLETLAFFEGICSDSQVAQILGSPRACQVTSRPRHRNLFPLPTIQPCLRNASRFDRVASNLTNLSVFALNSMHGFVGFGTKVMAAHFRIHEILFEKWKGLLSHFDSETPVLLPDVALAQVLSTEVQPNVGVDTRTPGARLRASDVDLLEHCGRVDPLPFIPPEHRAIISSPSKLFGSNGDYLGGFRHINSADKKEYAILVARQLLCKKVDLAFSVLGGGTVFSIQKKDSNRVREIWHGSRVSTAACKPPPPLNLLTPSALLSLETTWDQPLRISKRDGRILYDQLMLPAPLLPYMGRPPLRVNDLVGTGLISLYDVRRSSPSAPNLSMHSFLFPRSKVFPMGFSWSSYIAQGTMTAVCQGAGLWPHMQLADELPPPKTSQTFGLATDDVVHFSPSSPTVIQAAMDRLDRSFKAHGVLKNDAKDVTAALNGTAVGVDLVDGRSLWANKSKLRLLLPALVACLRASQLRPLDLAKVLGHVQWLNLLNRPLFSNLDTSYSFARLPNQTVPHTVPSKVRRELAMVLCLSMFWCFRLTKEWHTELLATDASPSYGFGASRMRCSVALAREIGRLAEKRGDYVTLFPKPGSGVLNQSRIGAPHCLPFGQERFSTIIRTPARFPAHPGLLEAHGVVRLGLEWLARSPVKYGRRLTLLLDAKAILGAIAKGRTSANTIKLQVMRIASLLLATDTTLHPVYVPSEHNPADAPSRGV